MLKLLIKLIKKDFVIFLNISNLLLIILSFIITIICNFSEIKFFSILEKKNISFEDAMFLSFRGPGNEYTFFQLLKWILPLVVILFISGRITTTELNKGYIYAIYRFGNKNNWLKGKFVFVFLFSFFYYICLYGLSIIVFLFKFPLKHSFDSYIISSFEMHIRIIRYISPLKLIIIILSLNILSCYILLILQLLISIITKKTYCGFLIPIMLVFISLTSNKICLKSSMLFPLNYGIATRFNEVTSLGYICYFYIVILMLSLMAATFFIVSNKEVFT